MRPNSAIRPILDRLHFFITPAGGATWRVKYRIEAKEKIYFVGPYPLPSLAAARVEMAEVKALLLESKYPVTERRVSRAATAAVSDYTFKAVAQGSLEIKQRDWSAVHYVKSQRAFERDVYPAIGNLPVSSITPAIVHKRDVLETAMRCPRRSRFDPPRRLNIDPGRGAGDMVSGCG